jgi:predicted RNase H-like HicB family nuclease
MSYEALGEIGMQFRQFIAIIKREADGYVALCPELDIASQGDSVEAARYNLVEAIELFLEVASPDEVVQRLVTQLFITQVSVPRCPNHDS